jgi:hypothetical protein
MTYALNMKNKIMLVSLLLALGCAQNENTETDSGEDASLSDTGLPTACGGVTFVDGKYYVCVTGCNPGTLVNQPGLDEPAMCVASCVGCNS